MTETHGTIQAQLDALPNDDNWAIAAVELILQSAEQSGCSDVHVLMRPDLATVRGRRHGALFLIGRIPVERQDMLMARFKVMARLSAFVRQTPQDGRIERGVDGNGRSAVLRVSFLPTIHGESLVVRFPHEDAEELPLENLGMPQPVLAKADQLLARQEGMIVVTGPTSSGKTTTLYAMIRRLHDRHGDRLNFVTIEDPVERDLRFASQVQVNEAQDLTFERALRSALRHDPNVLLIGEIRDAQTALIAAQAGMSGGVVLTSLHAGRASRVPMRLLSMGLPPYLVASALSGCIAQRLARVLCAKCRRKVGEGRFESEGCEACARTGISGRIGLFEIVANDERLREMILERSTPNQISEYARQLQVGDLSVQARELANEGVISADEAELVLALEE